jgi:protocatechuate 3,4-dioxygenase beta subunit
MSRVLAGLVALLLVPVLGSAQLPPPPLPDGAVINVISTVQGGIGTVTIQTAPGRALPPQAPARDQGAPKTGTSVIRGRVVGADTGLGLRRAVVRLNGAELRESRSTVTDADGRYEFGNLPAGRYSVFASKTSYVDLGYGQRQPRDMSKQLDVGDKQVVEKIDFVLPRSGVITGRILDEFGEPIANANVQPMQNRFMNGQRRPMPSGQGASTPDTGEFRLWGLQPGDYLVSVTPRQNGNTSDNSDDRSGYAATYYPGTSNLALAQPITLAVGQTASGVDIMLTPVRTAKVSGTAVDSKGQPIQNGFVTAMQRVGSMMFSNIGGQIREGTFTISGIPPGDYLLRANAMMQPRSGNEPPEILTAMVAVNGADISGVQLVPIVPVIVTGRVVFDPATAAPNPASVRVLASPKSPEMMMGMIGNMGPPVVKDDLSFELKAAPGLTMIRAVVGGPGTYSLPLTQGSWLLKSVRYHSTDVTDVGLELMSGRDVSDVEIVMTNLPQIVTGQITNARGEAVKDGAVLVFGQDKEQWGTQGRYTSIGRPDKDGKYTVRTLPPGDYFAIAVEQIDSQRFSGDPDYFDMLSRSAVRFSLVEGDTRTVDLKLVVQQ